MTDAADQAPVVPVPVASADVGQFVTYNALLAAVLGERRNGANSAFYMVDNVHYCDLATGTFMCEDTVKMLYRRIE